MSFKKIGWLLAVSIFTLSVNANDDNKVYRVEILVFQNLDKSQMEGENWSENPGYPRFEKAIKLLPLETDEIENEVFGIEQNTESFVDMEMINEASPQMAENAIESEEASVVLDGLATPQNESLIQTTPSYWIPYQLLKEEELYLKPFRDRLLKSVEYLPMRLSGWVQSVESREQARAVYLGDRVLDTEDSEDVVSETVDDQSEFFDLKPALIFDIATSTENFDAIMTMDEVGTGLGRVFSQSVDEPNAQDEQSNHQLLGEINIQDEQPNIEGIVRVSKATYFHVDVDMALNLPVQDTTEDLPYFLDDNWRAVFRLFESRRVKLEQINYFDHPAFGVLVYVSEIKPVADDEVAPLDKTMRVSLSPAE